MTDNIKQFLEADALRTQGEPTVIHRTNVNIGGRYFAQTGGYSSNVEGDNWHEDNAHNALFIAAASRIAPEIKALQDAFEQVCALVVEAEKIIAGSITMQDEYTGKQEQESGYTCDVYLMPVEREWVAKCIPILRNASPFRKTGV